MYLTKEIYIGANYNHNKVEGKIDLSADGKEIPINLKKVSKIVEHAAYWRKSNAIHNWFVKNVQDGEDDCKEYPVSFKQLMQLKETCKKVLEKKSADGLEPVGGFFFGSTEVDEYYFGDIQETIIALEGLDAEGDYYYRASW